MKLVNYWQLANCRLYNYKLETNTLLESEVSPRASTLYWVFKKGNKESNNCARSVRNSPNNRHKWRQIWYVIATFVLLYDTTRFQVVVRLQCVFQKEYDWSPFKLNILNEKFRPNQDVRATLICPKTLMPKCFPKVPVIRKLTPILISTHFN